MPDSDLPPQLVATDLDGTLLRSDKTVSSFTRRVIRGLEARDIPVVPVTARQPYGLRPIAEHVGLTGPAICANGAVGIDISSGQVWLSQSIAAADVRGIVERIRAVDDGVLFATIGPAGEWFRAEDAYAAASRFSDHQRTRREMDIVDVAGLAAEDCSKLVMRKPGEDPAALLARVGGLVGDCAATISGAPFVEVMAPGVTKANGLARLCERLGVDRERVWAFGDAPNDVDMLEWAGKGFAVAGAGPAVRAVADHIVGDNDDDGVARWLEGLLRQPTVE